MWKTEKIYTMLRITILLFVSLISIDSYGQDLIITPKNDSIECRIRDVRDGRIYYVPKGKKRREKVTQLLEQIKKYEYNYKIPSKNPIKVKQYDSISFPRLRFALGGGYSYHTILTIPDGDEAYKSHKRNLRNGLNFQLEASYFFTSYLGAGAKFVRFQTKSSIENYGKDFTGTLSDDIAVSYIGPMVSFRYLFNKNKHALIGNVSAGYLRFYNNFSYSKETLFTGNTIGYVFDLGYDIAIYKKWSVGIQFSFLMGTVSEMSKTTGSGTETIASNKNLNRLDFSIGLRFSL